jgi:hypothetical protein
VARTEPPTRTVPLFTVSAEAVGGYGSFGAADAASAERVVTPAVITSEATREARATEARNRLMIASFEVECFER